MNNYFILILGLFIMSCNGDKEKLLETYNELQSIIKDSDGIGIYNSLDEKSKGYVDFLIDSTNNDYLIMKNFGESVGYPLFTTIYHKSFSGAMESDEVSLDKFMLYLKLSSVPMFNAFQETRLVDGQTEVGESNYITVALEVGKNTFITSRIFFVEENGQFKFNLLDLLNTSENIYKQQYQSYVKNYGRKRVSGSANVSRSKMDIDYPNDMLKSFLENMDKSENSIKSLRYKK